MNETYRKIIPLLQESLDWKAICFQVAALHPEAFHEAYCATGQVEVHGYVPTYGSKARQVVVDALNGSKANKIRAIKAHRELTGADLLTSKNFVEEVINDLIDNLDF